MFLLKRSAGLLPVFMIIMLIGVMVGWAAETEIVDRVVEVEVVNSRELFYL